MFDTDQLTQRQQAILSHLASCHPEGHFDGCMVLLERYVRAADQALDLDGAIDQFKTCPTASKELSRFEKLLNLRINTTALMLELARGLRIRQHDKFGPRKAARMSRAAGCVPWEISLND